MRGSYPFLAPELWFQPLRSRGVIDNLFSAVLVAGGFTLRFFFAIIWPFKKRRI